MFSVIKKHDFIRYFIEQKHSRLQIHGIDVIVISQEKIDQENKQTWHATHRDHSILVHPSDLDLLKTGLPLQTGHRQLRRPLATAVIVVQSHQSS